MHFKLSQSVISASKWRDASSSMRCSFSEIKNSNSLNWDRIQWSSAISSSMLNWGASSPSGKSPWGLGLAANLSGIERSVSILRISVAPVCLNKTENPTSSTPFPSTVLTLNFMNWESGWPLTLTQWKVQVATTKLFRSVLIAPFPVITSPSGVCGRTCPSMVTFANPHASFELRTSIWKPNTWAAQSSGDLETAGTSTLIRATEWSWG